MKKTDTALASGIETDYVLMDTWFTTEAMLNEILKQDLMQLAYFTYFAMIHKTWIYQMYLRA